MFFCSSEKITRLPSPLYSCPYCHAPDSIHLIQIKKKFYICCIPLGHGKLGQPMYRCTNCYWSGAFIASLPKDELVPSIIKEPSSLLMSTTSPSSNPSFNASPDQVNPNATTTTANAAAAANPPSSSTDSSTSSTVLVPADATQTKNREVVFFV